MEDTLESRIENMKGRGDNQTKNGRGLKTLKVLYNSERLELEGT